MTQHFLPTLYWSNLKNSNLDFYSNRAPGKSWVQPSFYRAPQVVDWECLQRRVVDQEHVAGGRRGRGNGQAGPFLASKFGNPENRSFALGYFFSSPQSLSFAQIVKMLTYLTKAVIFHSTCENLPSDHAFPHFLLRPLKRQNQLVRNFFVPFHLTVPTKATFAQWTVDTTNWSSQL